MGEIKEKRVAMRSIEEGLSLLDSDNPIATGLHQHWVPVTQADPGRVLSLPAEARLSRCGSFVQWRNHWVHLPSGSASPTAGDPFSTGEADSLSEEDFRRVCQSLAQVVEMPGDRPTVEMVAGRRDWSDTEDVLRQFMLLKSCDPERIARFVRRWGPLDIYEYTHSADTEEDEVNHGPWYAEPLSVYRRYATLMWGTLAVAAALYQGKEPSLEDWCEAGLGDAKDLEVAKKYGYPPLLDLNSLVERNLMAGTNLNLVLGIKDHRSIVTIDVTCEMELEDWKSQRDRFVRDFIHDNQDQWVRGAEEAGRPVDLHRLALEARKFHSPPRRPSLLFNCLVLRTIACISSGLYRCSECGVPYTPKRQPRDSNHYCSDDCKAMGHRKRSQKSYQTRKQTKK